MKKAAVINDLSGFGKCSLTAAIPVLSALGVQCCPLATAVLTGQTGYPYFHCTDLTDMMPQYIDAWAQNNAHFDAIYSGYMTGRKQIEHLLDLITQFRRDDTLLLVDPVMGDDGRVPLRRPKNFANLPNGHRMLSSPVSNVERKKRLLSITSPSRSAAYTRVAPICSTGVFPVPVICSHLSYVVAG